MLSPNKLASQIDQARQRTSRLQQQSAGDSNRRRAELLPIEIEELQTAFEELQVAQEELARQNEALALSRELIDRERKRYYDLFEFAPDGYVTTDPHGSIFDANEAASRLFGVPSKYLAGKPLAVFVSLADRGAFRALLWRLQKENASQEATIQLAPRDGSDRTVSLTVAPRFDPDNPTVPVELRWLIRDVTERAKLEAELRKAKAKLDAQMHSTPADASTSELTLDRQSAPGTEAPHSDQPHTVRRPHTASIDENHFQSLLLQAVEQPIVATDRRGRIVYWNKGSEELFGWTRSEALGHRAVDILPAPPARDEAKAVISKLAKKLDWSGELALVKKDAAEFPAMIHASSVFGPRGKTMGNVAIVFDLSEQREAARRLAEARDTAEQASRAKDQFLAVLSHELRTPLTPVLAAIHSIEQDDAVRPEFRSAIQMIARNVQLEARLIDDLLDLTRIGRGKLSLQLERLDMHELIGHVVEIFREEIEGSGLVIEKKFLAENHFVDGDPTRLHQVIWNVFRNAVKFTPTGGTITVRTRDDNKGQLRIEVSDTGIGIDKEILPRIFDSFEQGDELIMKRFGGLGLGLAISKSLVELHSGTISAKSGGRLKGTTLTITLPALAVQQPTAGTQEPAGAPGMIAESGNHMNSAPNRILLVDDHTDTRMVLKLLLERKGYKVMVADSVETAFAAARSHRFDLLISDIGLPDGSGHDLLKRVRSLQPMKAIALSGFGMEQDVGKSKAAGFYDHLVKPISFQKLDEMIHSVLTPDGDPPAS